MTSNDLLQIIGLSPTATSKEIDAAYNTKKKELSERIVNAPTEALKNKYQSSLDELESLYRAVHQNQSITKPSGLSATMMADLPQAQPFYTEDGGVGPEVTTSSQLGIISGDILMDRYEVRRLLGAGGMGAVYAAYDKNTEREIAVKVLLPNLFSNERAQERFMNEAKLSQQLSHPGIINVFDVQRDESKGVYFLTMELLEGQTLRHAMDVRRETGKQFSTEEVVEIAAQLCDALSYAHKYTVHRDLKPENVFMTESGEIKLMDFGIARVMETSQLTKTGTSMGTAYYMSPEQLRGAGEVDGRSDQYSLSVILYELLSGEVPIGMIKPLTAQRPDVSKGLSFAISKGLSSSPSDRYETILECLSGLKKKGGQISLPSGRLLAVVGVISLLLTLGVTYPGWGPTVMSLFEDPELAGRVEGAHKAVLLKQEVIESHVELLDIPLPKAASDVEGLMKEGTRLESEKDLEEALGVYNQALSSYELVLSDLDRQLYNMALESHGRVIALKDQLDGKRKDLEDRIDDARRLVDKYERQNKTEELARLQRELALLLELEKLSERTIFNGNTSVKVRGKMQVTENMLRDKHYAESLSNLKIIEQDVNLLLANVSFAEKALRKRVVVEKLLIKWDALVAKGVENIDIEKGVQEFKTGTDDLGSGKYQAAVQALNHSADVYRAGIVDGKEQLRINALREKELAEKRAEDKRLAEERAAEAKRIAAKKAAEERQLAKKKAAQQRKRDLPERLTDYTISDELIAKLKKYVKAIGAKPVNIKKAKFSNSYKMSGKGESQTDSIRNTEYKMLNDFLYYFKANTKSDNYSGIWEELTTLGPISLAIDFKMNSTSTFGDKPSHSTQFTSISKLSYDDIKFDLQSNNFNLSLTRMEKGAYTSAETKDEWDRNYKFKCKLIKTIEASSILSSVPGKAAVIECSLTGEMNSDDIGEFKQTFYYSFDLGINIKFTQYSNRDGYIINMEDVILSFTR